MDKKNITCGFVLENTRQAWSCTIGSRAGVNIPPGGDFPMRVAVRKAFREVTGEDAEATFSGWGAKFSEDQLAVIENRMPREEQPPSHPAIPDDVRHVLTLALGLLKHTDPEPWNRDVLKPAIDQASAWLDKCRTATDKAVCPKCGEETENFDADELEAHCITCGENFSIKILVISSPPREQKVEP